MVISRPGLTSVEAFLGVQYATAERFQRPRTSTDRWQGVRVTRDFGPVCPQKVPDMDRLTRTMPRGRLQYFRRLASVVKNQNENCLNLNLYVPMIHSATAVRSKDKRNVSSATPLLPVVLIVHGERSYDVGTGNVYDGSLLAAFGSVVVITLNYRLGLLGFLSTGTQQSSVQGNYALYDILAALEWVKKNVRLFGGDHQHVTLMGQGHGAALVHLLTISPRTAGDELFHRVILQSGSALNPWAVVSKPDIYIRQFFTESTAMFNCTQLITHPHPQTQQQQQQVVDCLRQVPVDRLIHVNMHTLSYMSTLGPVVNVGDLLTSNVRHLMMLKESTAPWSRTSLLLGFVSNEGFIYLNQSEVDEGVTLAQLGRVVKTYVSEVYESSGQDLYNVLMYQYKHGHHDLRADRDRPAVRDLMMRLLADGHQVSPLIETARRHVSMATHPSPAAGGPGETYVYCMATPTRADVNPRWADAVYADDLHYLFGLPLTTDSSAPQRALSLLVMRYWVNFIRSGNPNDDGSFPNVEAGYEMKMFWPPFDLVSEQYLHIGVNTEVRQRYKAEAMAFWLHLVPKLHRHDIIEPVFHATEVHDNSTDGTTMTIFTEAASTPDAVFRLSEDGSIWMSSGRDELETSDDGLVMNSTSVSATGEMGSGLLLVTLAVGGTLLVINCTIFIAMLRHRSRRFKQLTNTKPIATKSKPSKLVTSGRRQHVRSSSRVHFVGLSPSAPSSPTDNKSAVTTPTTPVPDSTDNGQLHHHYHHYHHCHQHQQPDADDDNDTLRPVTAAVPGTMRRTLYSPRYTSDGRLKHCLTTTTTNAVLSTQQ